MDYLQQMLETTLARVSRIILAMIPLWGLSSLNVTAAESTEWLINNAVSMMDWGSAKAEKSAQRAGDFLNELMEKRAKNDSELNDSSVPENVKKAILQGREQFGTLLAKQYGFKYGSVYAGYDQPRDRIVVGVFVAPRFYVDTTPGKIDAESCIGIVEDFQKTLIDLSGAESAQQLASDFWFTHNGYKSTAMPPKFAKDLAEHITVVIHLDNYPILDSAFTCEEPLPGGPVSVMKKKSK
jgi:hypothetical protein